MLAALAVVAAVATFGPPGPLAPHRATLRQAEDLASAGDYARAAATLHAAAGAAGTEAADLLVLHARMLERVRQLDEHGPGLGRRYVRYVFAPTTALLPGSMSDLVELLPHDPGLQALLATPWSVDVETEGRAVGLLLRGALVDTGRRRGLPLLSSPAGTTLRVFVDLDPVDRRHSILEGTGMHSYTTSVVVALERDGAVALDNGVVVQLLGINATRAIDANRERLVDRILNGVVVELVRRSLLGSLAP
jgi:hypothetical protein